MRLPARVLVVAGVATVVIVGGGVLALGGSDEPEDRAHRGAVHDHRTGVLRHAVGAGLAREPFCEAVDQRQVEAALDGEVDSSTSWQDGDTIEVADGVEDVAHEFGCQYAGADGTMARAWVFAPPVDAAQAERLSRNAGQGPGCETADGPAFGAPTLALVCTKAGIARASHRGPVRGRLAGVRGGPPGRSDVGCRGPCRTLVRGRARGRGGPIGTRLTVRTGYG